MIENLNLDNAQKEVTVTNMELDKKDGQKVTTEEVAIGLKVEPIQPGKTEDLLPGQAAEGDHDGRDGDPELVNFLMDDKDKYIKVEIRADVVDGKPVIRTEEEIKTSGGQLGKYLIWAKFLRPSWKLGNILNRNLLSINLQGNTVIDEVELNERIVKYLLKEWNLPFQLIFGFDGGTEIISNFDTLSGSTGVSPQILIALVGKAKQEVTKTING